MPVRRNSGAAVDWQAIHEKLARASLSARAVAELSPERTRQILEQRACELACPPVETSVGASIDVLAFRLGNEQYGIETRYVREVLRFTDFAPVPGVPDYVIGVANLRGEIIAVFDLQRLFQLASQGLPARSHVIVCGELQPEFAIVTDSVQEVTDLPLADLVSEPLFAGERGRDCIRGVTRTALVVLDGAALLSDARLHIDMAADA